jgi:hypothetical protein
MVTTHAMAAIGTEDIIIGQGTSWALSWIYGEGDPAAAPEGWPASWSGRAQVRLSWGVAPAVASFHSADPESDGLVLLNTNEDGLAVVTLSLDPTASDDWTWSRGVYDVELADTAGRVIRLVEGRAELSAEVTR